MKTIEVPDLVVFQSEEWSVLYGDGKLLVVGDHNVADERIAEFLDVKYASGGEILMPDDCKRDAVPKTLDEALAKIAGRDEAEQKIRDLHREAAALRARADELERLLSQE